MNLISHKYIDEYLEYVDAYPDRISKDVKLLIKNIVTPILNDINVFFDVDTFEKCIAFSERWFYPLFPYQKFRYAFAFMYRKDNLDVVTFPDQFDVMGRGNGKDGYLMPLAAFLLTPMYGVKNYHIDIVATSEDQALNSFNVVWNMLEDNKKIMSKMFYWNRTEIINKITKSRLRYNTANAKTKDGKQSGMVIYNELHAYEDYKQINVFRSGLGKIKHARTWTITTSGTLRQGPLDEKISTSLQILNGEHNHLGMFPFICRMSSEEDAHLPMAKFLESNVFSDIDTSCWEQANPSIHYLPILREQIISDYLQMMTQSSYRTEFFTKRMNLMHQNEEVTVTSWKNIERASFYDVVNRIARGHINLTGRNAIVGIDLATFNDFVSAGFLFKDGKELIWKSKTWICKRSKFFNEIKFDFNSIGTPGYTDFEIVDEDFIDERDVVTWIFNEMGNYNVLKIVSDSHRYQLLKKGFEEYGFSAESRHNPDGLLRVIRLNSSIYNILAPLIEKKFVEGNINIGDSAMMRWSINNTAMIRNKNGDLTFEKIEPKLRKNDPFMAFVHAMQAHEMLDEQIIQIYM